MKLTIANQLWGDFPCCVAGRLVVAGACGTVIPGGGTGYDCREKRLVGCCAAVSTITGAAAGAGCDDRRWIQVFLQWLAAVTTELVGIRVFCTAFTAEYTIPLFSAYPVLM